MPRNKPEESVPEPDETSDVERERVRSSNDREQQLERERAGSERNRGYDEAAPGPTSDPDSAEADIDRDDLIDEV